LNWCADSELLDHSPFPRRVMPKLQELPPKRVSDEEADRLRALPEPYGFVCRLALGTGLRWAELCRAQASDVQRGELHVYNTKSRRLRRVPLSPDLLAEVRTHVGRLVPFAAGSPGSFAKTVGKLTKIERFSVHKMRHTFASQWADRGGNLGVLQLMLGHKSIETTQRYARLSDEAVAREVERVAAGGGRHG
jgi:integrase